MNQEKPYQSALKVNEGVAQPETLNQAALDRLRSRKKEIYTASTYSDGILKGDIVLLSQAITLIESSLPEHQIIGQEVIMQCLPASGNAIRLGLTGVPGVGKSTFIEALGMYLLGKGSKVAVLAIDPSSQRSKGSILGDKTRMEQLSVQENAYIRPSASSGTLGGVARKTHETIILCEAAGFDTIIVETVGVGQSETAVHSMVDFFLLLLISGAGDELQGIKRGIMEMADGIAVNKADGDNIIRANRAKAECENALHLFPNAEAGINPKVITCSAIENKNIAEVWQMVTDFMEVTHKNGFFEQKRLRQAVQIMHNSIENRLKSDFLENEAVKSILPKVELAIKEQKLSSYIGAASILETYYNQMKK